MRLPLFRREVMEAQAGRWAGSIVLLRPVPMRLAAWISFLLLIAIACYLACGHYTRKVTVSGRIMPVSGAIKTVAPQFGRLIARSVQEGDVVAEGQVLFELSSERSGRSGGVEMRVAGALLDKRRLLEQESRAQARQLEQRQADLRSKQESLRAELSVLERDFTLQQKRVALADANLRRFASLREQGFVSEAQLAQNEIDLAEQQSKLQAIERSRLVASRELEQTLSDLSQLASQAEITNLQSSRALASLDQEMAEQEGRDRIRILAPTAGIVTALAIDPGESVSAGAVLATIVPRAAQFEAQLLAPSHAVGLIAQGQPVRLRLAAFPYQKFGYVTGKVRIVEQGPLTESAQPKAESIYRIAVSLDKQTMRAYGKTHFLKAGMAVDADIKQDRRRLIEWLLDPLKSVANAAG